MRLDWAKRFKNKTFVVNFTTVCVAFVYQVASLFGVVPAISEEELLQTLGVLINMIAILGVVANPTTPGISD